MTAVVREAHDGCFIFIPCADMDNCESLPNWCLNYDEYVDQDQTEDMPDLAIDPDDGILSIYNTSDRPKTYFVTVENCSRVLSAEGLDLLDIPALGTRRSYVTFIVLLWPNTFMDVCTLVPKLSPKQKKNMKKNGGRLSHSALQSIHISSDIQEYTPTPSPASETPAYDLTVFPLHHETDKDMSWLCTQASGGALTHFAHASTFHAVDWRCAVGTPVVAVFDGVVLEVKVGSGVSGSHVSNLFSWNSILIKRLPDLRAAASGDGSDSTTGDRNFSGGHDGEATRGDERQADHTHINVDTDADALYVEYVHISNDGVRVREGDIVRAGDVICLSGDAGFCPEPHLHVQLQRGAREVGAPSVPLRWKGEAIRVGEYYP